MDAIELLTSQHRDVEKLFERFTRADGPDERERIASETISELRLHTTIEEELFYPAIREQGDELEDSVLEDLEEHHVIEVLLDELESMQASAERFVAKFTVLTELVTHHVEEEEDEQFPLVREKVGDARLAGLGQQMLDRYRELKDEAETDAMTKEELYERAKELGVEGRSAMSKRELGAAVRAAD